MLSPDSGCPPPRCHGADTELRARGRISPTETGFLLLFLAGVARRLSRAFSEFADRRAWLLTAGSIFSSGAPGPDKAGGLNEKQRGVVCPCRTAAGHREGSDPALQGAQLSGRDADFGVLWLAPGEKHPSKPSCCPSRTPRDTDPAGFASPPPPPPPPSHSCLTSYSSTRGGTAAGNTNPGHVPCPQGPCPSPTRDEEPRPSPPALPRPRRRRSPRARQR